MQLPLTSIIPSTVELISFWEKNWSHIWWFPNWYLGVPYRFLTGPIVPVLVILVRKIVPVSIETIYIGLIGVMGVIGGIGVNFFCKEMGAGKRTAGFISLLYIILPFSVWFLTISSGLGNIAISVVPWIWVAFLRSLKSLKEFKLIRGKIYLLTTALLTALVLLINPATILATTIGMGILVFLGERKLWIDKSLKLLIVLLSGSSIATIWYSPRFWWILLGNPSFAGKPLVNVIHFVLQLTEAVVPLILGIWIVQKKHILYSKNVQFAVLFGASFLFLSVIRLLSDADFWMDWIGYILELQLAVAIAGGYLVSRYLKKRIMAWFVVAVIVAAGIYILPTSFRKNQDKIFQQGITDLVNSVREDSRFRGNDNENERYFFSGSPVFWASAKMNTNIIQVRGARDEVATNPVWAMAAYQIREGEHMSWVLPLASPKITRKGTPILGLAELASPITIIPNSVENVSQAWLKILGVKYLLVHSEGSREYFHDFKNLDRFNVLEKVIEGNGDILFSANNSIARLADRQILKVPKPASGDDYIAISQYAETLKQNIAINLSKPDEIKIASENPNTNSDVISIAVTADRGWKIVQGEGEVKADNFGNLVLIPKSGNSWTIKYSEGWFWLPGAFLGLISLALLIMSDRWIGKMMVKVPSLGLGSGTNEEEEY